MRRLIKIGGPLALTLLLVLAAPAAAEDVPRLPDVGSTATTPVGDDAPVVPSAEEILSNAQDGGAPSDGPGADDPISPSPGDLGPAALLGEPAVQALLVGLAVSLFGLAWFYGGARIVSRDEVLENDTRRAIYEHLKREVGCNLKEITEALDLTTTNAIWHLRKLEEARLVHSRRFNGYKIFYPAEGGIAARKLSLSKTALGNDNARAVFEYVVATPGAHQRQIARALDVNHGTVRWHLKKLQKAELLREVKEGKASKYFATGMGHAALQAITSDSPPSLDAVAEAVKVQPQ